MFGTRLNPMKPGAAYRATLERAGIACRELRTAQETIGALATTDERVRAVFAKHGLFKIGVPPEYGGVAADPLLTVLALERLGREGLWVVGFFLLDHAIALSTITRWATVEQKMKLLPHSIAGQHSHAFCAQAMSWIQQHPEIHVEQNAERFLINGRVRCSRGAAACGTVIIVAEQPSEGIRTAILVNAGQPGMQIRPRPVGDAWWDDFLGDLEFINCAVTEASILGARRDGLRILSAAQSDARLGIAAGCLGVLADSLEILAPIASDRLRTAESEQARQSIERYVAGIATDLEASRGLVYAAAELKAEFDRRPTSEHLASESDTLIREATYFATRSIHRLHAGAESVRVADHSLLEFLPTRHRIDMRPSGLFEEPDRDLEHHIAAYYLDFETPANSQSAGSDKRLEF